MWWMTAGQEGTRTNQLQGLTCTRSMTSHWAPVSEAVTTITELLCLPLQVSANKEFLWAKFFVSSRCCILSELKLFLLALHYFWHLLSLNKALNPQLSGQWWKIVVVLGSSLVEVNDVQIWSRACLESAQLTFLGWIKLDWERMFPTELQLKLVWPLQRLWGQAYVKLQQWPWWELILSVRCKPL